MNRQGKKTIVFLTSLMLNKLSKRIWLGIREKLDEEGYNSICMAGGGLKIHIPLWAHVSANRIYEMATPETADGVIVYGGALGQLITNREMFVFCENYKPLPVINIALKLPDMPNININNREGFYSITKHMIKHHHYRKIALIRGPEGHWEAEQRFKGFMEAHKDAHRIVDPLLILPGDFSRNAGTEGVKLLLDRRGIVPDAIMCIDDDTALGVLEELNRRKIKVPEQIAVTGFDDIEEARYLTPSLTTVRQDFKEIGRKAAENIIKMINGKRVTSIEVGTQLKLRSSCGCYAEELKSLLIPECIESPESISKESIPIIANQIIKESRNITQALDYQGLTDLIKTWNTHDESLFLDQLSDFLGNALSEGIDHFSVQMILSIIQNKILNTCEQTDQTHSLEIFERARIIVGETFNSREGLKRIHQESSFIDLDLVLHNLINHTVSKEHLWTVTAENLERIKVHDCFIATYVNPENPETEAKLVFQYQQDKKIPLPDNRTFPLKEGLPDEIIISADDRPYHLIMDPLYVSDQHIGYIIYNSEKEVAENTDSISWQLSNIIKGLENLTEKAQRTRELENAIEILTTTQKQLIESEKMASLGNLVAGVAHELNTPLGIGVTYSTYLEEITERLIKKVDNGLDKEELVRLLEKTKSTSQGIVYNLKRAADLIKSFKNVAIDRNTERQRRFDICEYLEDILKSLHNKIKQKNHQVILESPSSLEIESYPGPFSQVITNLIINSLKHGFKEKTDGIIHIKVTHQTEWIEILYSDNGIGMDQNTIKNIYEPFFTTQRDQGGSGLGMHIVYNIVNQTMGGEISCKSSPGEGVEFLIKIPSQPPKRKDKN